MVKEETLSQKLMWVQLRKTELLTSDLTHLHTYIHICVYTHTNTSI